MEPVLQAEAPGFTTAEAIVLGAEKFGVRADRARSLGSERDQTFLLALDDDPVAVLKVSNAVESADTLDMEALVVHHLARVDAGLPVARPMMALHATDPDSPSSYRSLVSDESDTRSSVHWTRAYPVMPGRMRADPSSLDDRSLVAWGHTLARLAKAMRGFSHPRAHRSLPWDLKSVPLVRGMIPSIQGVERQSLVRSVLDRYDQTIGSRWDTLRAQVVHGDLNIDNALLDDDGLICGIVDFGDMTHTALITDLASSIDSLVLGREGDDMFRVARLVLDGYQRVTPLEPEELILIGDAWASRAAAGIAIASWRSAEGLEDPAFVERDLAGLERILRHMVDTGFDQVATQISGIRPHPSRQELAQRRAQVLGPALEPLTYAEPVFVERAEGVWIYDVNGDRLLDAYNNVPCVGHAHPRVTEAIARQSRSVNTHMRYLHPAAIELAERLIATCPDGFDTVLFVNSGSEANDLAWRIATEVTGRRGALCTHFAYHGITEAIAAVSPETLFTGRTRDHVERWRPADSYRGQHLDHRDFEAAWSRLAARDRSPAAVILDGVMQSDGVLVLTPEYVSDLVRRTHDGGALWIADEVQGGHGRTGEGMWSFERFGIVPDFITLGKPMGNGHPVAAVITRRELLEGFADETVIFSTFGGNPVSAAAALAVLDVLDDERVLPRVHLTGQVLRHALGEVTADVPCVGQVRGVGLANGVEIVKGAGSDAPDRETADALKNALRRNGVLVGTCGEHSNVLKIRPPLAFTSAEVPLFVDAFVASLRQLDLIH
jgi:4-aminobutyrate aminotransferase-like enzyme/Ser/Thr protein kinase RdoA (MazF antagonist)